MTPTFEIIAQTSDQLIVHSPISLFSWVTLVPLVIGDGMALFFYLKMPRGLSASARSIPLLVGVLITAVFLVISIWSHTMTLSRDSGTATLEHKFAGITYATQKVPLANMERATLESARPGTRIAIILNGGAVVWPFGEAYNPRPNQYAVIDDINAFLGSTSAVPSGAKETPDEMERRMNEKFKDLEQNNTPARPK